jgi:hypothetical protein
MQEVNGSRPLSSTISNLYPASDCGIFVYASRPRVRSRRGAAPENVNLSFFGRDDGAALRGIAASPSLVEEKSWLRASLASPLHLS